MQRVVMSCVFKFDSEDETENVVDYFSNQTQHLVLYSSQQREAIMAAKKKTATKKTAAKKTVKKPAAKKTAKKK